MAANKMVVKEASKEAQKTTAFLKRDGIANEKVTKRAAAVRSRVETAKADEKTVAAKNNAAEENKKFTGKKAMKLEVIKSAAEKDAAAAKKAAENAADEQVQQST